MTAAEQWAQELASWRIDPAILAAAPESPYGFPPALFAPRDDVESPLLDLARAALPPGGTVLDVGAGAGAGSLGLGDALGRLHAVDSQPSMLRALEETAAGRGVEVTTYDGVWPAVAPRGAGVRRRRVLAVVYNVPDLVPFVTALTGHARRLVVVEVMGTHPWVRLAPMWEAVHGQSRPHGPTAELAVAVLGEAGIVPTVTEVVRDPAVRTGALREAWVDFTRRQLCLPPERRAEVERADGAAPAAPRRSVVLSWPGSAD